MTNKTNNNVYRLHTDEPGYVWFAYGSHMPVPSGQRPADFVKQSRLTQDDQACTMASMSNIDLILRLYERKLLGGLKSLKVCTPAAVPLSNRRKRPDVVLMDIDQWQGWPSSLGGWHEFGEQDLPSYYMARHYITGSEQDIEPILKNHPVWPSLSFIPHLDLQKCSRLLALLLDPRWYIDLEEPEKLSKLEGFLGLTPKVQYNVSTNSGQEVPGSDKCQLVMDTWNTGRPSKEEMKQPGYFLWRVHSTEGTGSKADLRASQVFISFLRNTWLNEIYRASNRVGGDSLFVPEYFFHTKDEAEAYKEHIKRCHVHVEK